MEPTAAQSPSSDLPAHAVSTPAGIRCRSCGYELSGLPIDGLCPECGAPVQASLRPDALFFSDPEWLARLHAGVGWATWAGVAVLLLPALILGSSILAVAGGLAPPITHDIALTVAAVAALLTMYGVWMLTTPEPDFNKSAALKSRRASRCLLIAGYSGACLLIVAQAVPALIRTPDFLVIAVLAGICAGWIMLFLYARHLFDRMNAVRLASSARTIAVVFAVFSCMIGAVFLPAAASALSLSPSSSSVPGFIVFGLGLLSCAGVFGYIPTLVVALVVLTQLGSRLGHARDRSRILRSGTPTRQQSQPSSNF